MKILTSANAKLLKSRDRGYISYGIHLAPHNVSGHNVCSHASPGCSASCLNTSGHGAFNNVQQARINKTLWMIYDRAVFLEQLWKEIHAVAKSALRGGMQPCFRLNLTSDLPWESIKRAGESPMQAFSDFWFYDYTKIPRRMSSKLPDNYRLTFSRSETNESAAQRVLAAGGNVAMVFAGKTLPKKYLGYRVVNGDEDDLRFLDPSPVIVGLSAKGKAKHDTSGFVIHTT